MSNDKFETIVKSRPIDCTSARVVAAGPKGYESAKEILQPCSAEPLPLKPIPPDAPQLIGYVRGKLTVVGLFAGGNPKKNALWVCRCACGYYTTRHAKSAVWRQRSQQSLSLAGLRIVVIVLKPRDGGPEAFLFGRQRPQLCADDLRTRGRMLRQWTARSDGGHVVLDRGQFAIEFPEAARGPAHLPERAVCGVPVMGRGFQRHDQKTAEPWRADT